jgi:hypothetical protein
VAADNDEHLAFVGKLASQMGAEYENYVRRSGGITPGALQDFAGRYLMALNPSTTRDISAQWLTYAARWPLVRSGAVEPGVEEFLAEVLLFLMSQAHTFAFDLFAASAELFEEWMENAQVVADNAARLRAETEGKT